MPSMRMHSPDAEIVKAANKALASGKLLETIKFPRNLKGLGDRLPQPNYDIKPFIDTIEISKSKLSQNESSKLLRGTLEPIPELTKVSDSFQEPKCEGAKLNIPKPNDQRYRKPRIVYSRENIEASELQNIADRKSSEERRKRLQELNKRIRLKNIPQKAYINIDLCRPPRPIVLNNRYQAVNPIKRAGLAVIESLNYIPVRASKN